MALELYIDSESWAESVDGDIAASLLDLKALHCRPSSIREFAVSHQKPPGGSNGMRIGAAMLSGGSFGGW
ncbi:hypothetical protein R3P38DRAFT_3215315 [Favolaschia claudopus]|uniref:Uncharacterized protein n=1 Tax=Favolaschia claudopus TaxID=2862362 RepID=A0AAW0AAH1_9AGAR